MKRTSSASRRVVWPLGIIWIAFGGGVVNVQTTSFCSVCPVADFVPAGTRAVNLVAIGKRLVVSNISVFVPSHRQRPSTCGDSSTGANSAACSCEADGNHRLRESDVEVRCKRNLALGRIANNAAAPVLPVSVRGVHLVGCRKFYGYLLPRFRCRKRSDPFCEFGLVVRIGLYCGQAAEQF